MKPGRLVFAQLMDLVSRYDFNRCVRRYQGDHRVRRFSCFDQWLTLAFAQLTYRDSLRDIEICLEALRPKLYHAGFRGAVCRSTLADANETRDWRIFADFAQTLIQHAQQLYRDDPLVLELDQTAYAFDTTTIDLCLALFPWAVFRRRKGAVKLHTLLDLRGNIPCFVSITHGKVNETRALDHLFPEPGSFYVFDRGFTDFFRLWRWSQQLAYFVIRGKHKLDFRRLSSRPVDPCSGLRCDQTIVLAGRKTRHLYPAPLRRITYVDRETHKRFVFLSNHFQLPALTIPSLYKERWQIELFFKWIKQHLRINSFYGNSENAVKIQIWTAVCVYLLVAIAKKRLRLPHPLSQILQILSVSLFEKVPIYQLFTGIEPKPTEAYIPNQLKLFDF